MMLLVWEAAFRSLLMAVVVWAGIRIFRVESVVAQKVAWVLVLAAAVLMPLAMRAPWLEGAMDRAGIQTLRIPVRRASAAARPATEPTQRQNAGIASGEARAAGLTPTAKPSAARHAAAWSFELHTSNSAAAIRQPAAPAQAPPALSQQPHAPTDLPNPSLLSSAQILVALGFAYLVVASILLLRTLAGLAIALRIRRRSIPLERNTPDAAGVRISRDLSTPVTIGSTILLPPDCEQWDETRLRIVLAHERSHVRQRDFYLQLAAALHVAVFWFSPLGWWLQRKLSELAEALGDRAGLAQAPNPAAYAQVLLEFAARPRTTPLAGVAMARNSNLSSRMERILNHRRFRLAFLGGGRHAILAAALVPTALVAAVVCIRFVPAVEAAHTHTTPATAQSGTQPVAPSASPGTSSDSKASASGLQGQVSGEMPEQVTSVETGQSSDQLTTPAPPVPPPANTEAPEPPNPPESTGFAYGFSNDGQSSYAIIRGKDSTVTLSGDAGKELEKARKKYHDNFIWFEHEGKSYVITDPAVAAQGESFFKGNFALDLRMKDLTQMQAKLDRELANIQPEIEKAKLPGPEFAAQMAKLEAELAELQSDKYKKMAADIAKQVGEQKMLTDEQLKAITDEKLGELQGKIGEIQGRLGEIQGKIGEREGVWGEKQGEIGEKMGKLGEEMGKIGEQEGKNAEEAGRKLKSLLDQAVRDGKAKPVE